MFHMSILHLATTTASAGFSGANIALSITASLLVIIGGVAAVVRPWGAKAKQRRRENRNFKIWMNGRPEVKGIFEAVIAAPEQMKLMKDHINILDDSLGKVKSGLTALGAKVAQGQDKTSSEIKELRDLMIPNGGDTNNPGDLGMRRAKREGDWIDDDK
jgi:hypothetical protein